MATLVAKTLSLSDSDPATAAANSGGDQVLNEAGLALVIENDDASSKTVTLASTVTAAPGVAAANVAVVVPAGAIRIAKIALDPRFSDANGMVQITYSAVTSLKISAVRL